MKRALLIEVDFSTGKRVGNINPRDPQLPCHGWQDMDSVPGREIRLVEDDRDLSQYEGMEGVTLLEGEAQINEAIDNIASDRYIVQNEALMLEHIRQKGEKLDKYAGKAQKDIIADLYQKGIAGIVKSHKNRV